MAKAAAMDTMFTTIMLLPRGIFVALCTASIRPSSGSIETFASASMAMARLVSMHPIRTSPHWPASVSALRGASA